MHATFFWLKRSYWGVQNKLRPELKDEFAITPARVDMLYAIDKSPWKWWKEQRRLAVKLGVCRSVVSRMLKAMEKRGWIRREKATYDRRLLLVSITEAGQELLGRVWKRYVLSREVAHWVYKALMGEGAWLKGQRFMRACIFEHDLFVFRRWFGGGGTLSPPFGHPYDD